MNQTVRYLAPVALAALACGLVAHPARADIIVNLGQTVNIVTQATIPVSGAPLATISGQASLGGSPVKSNINEAVYKDTTPGFGTDFAFQLINTGSAAISSLTLTNFNTYTTFVGDLTTAPTGFPGGTNGTTDPTRVTRGVLGNDLQFVFDTPLAPGATSSVFFVRTNATSFDSFGAGLTAGTLSTGGNVFINLLEPNGASVPEPGPLALAGCSAIALILGTRFRRRAS